MKMEIDEIDGVIVAYDTNDPGKKTYPVVLYNINGDETDDLEEGVGGVISLAEDKHVVFHYVGFEHIFPTFQ